MGLYTNHLKVISVMKLTHYHLEIQANPPKIVQKNRYYFLHLEEKQDYPMTFFKNSNLGLSMLNFEADDAKVLIYLTFMFY